VKASQRTIDLIKQFEGLRLRSYQDQRGIWTVGYGHTGPEVGPHTVWSESQANLALVGRINAIAGILTGCIVPFVSQNQFDALVSLAYNIGQGAFRGSTLMKKLNQRDFEGAGEEFLKWDHNHDGTVNLGLRARRAKEAALFAEPDKPSFLAAPGQ
jgi:lysozyme